MPYITLSAPQMQGLLKMLWPRRPWTAGCGIWGGAEAREKMWQGRGAKFLAYGST